MGDDGSRVHVLQRHPQRYQREACVGWTEERCSHERQQQEEKLRYLSCTRTAFGSRCLCTAQIRRRAHCACERKSQHSALLLKQREMCAPCCAHRVWLRLEILENNHHLLVHQ